MWYYLVAAFILTDNGQQALIRAVGPFQVEAVCEVARNAENRALWVGDKCFEAFMETNNGPTPWSGKSP